MKPLSDCRLYTFVDTAYLRGRAPELVAQQLCDGGSDLIQLRAKNASPAEIRRMALAILPITQRANVGLVINDHPDITAEVGAEFCHLGQEDFFDAGETQVSRFLTKLAETKSEKIARPHPDPLPQEREEPSSVVSGQIRANIRSHQSSPSQLSLGLSTHAPKQAERALAAGPAYIAIGPVYATGTKPTAKPVTLEYVRWAAAQVSIPWFAIGGINLQNLDDVLAAGAQKICVVSAILNASDVAAACREFKRRLA